MKKVLFISYFWLHSGSVSIAIPLPKEGGFKNNTPEKVIIQAGNLFLYQNPKNFWNQTKIENDQGNKFRIKFIGSVDKEILDQVELAGFLPYPEMIKQILEADLL